MGTRIHYIRSQECDHKWTESKRVDALHSLNPSGLLPRIHILGAITDGPQSPTLMMTRPLLQQCEQTDPLHMSTMYCAIPPNQHIASRHSIKNPENCCKPPGPLTLCKAHVNLLTIGILSRGKCGLSKCVTRYLVAMAAADLLVIIIDLILRQIPIRFRDSFIFLYYIRVCNIHAILLYAATDCSVWFTVAFTFDRFVAICCRKLKTRYCTEKTADMILGAVTLLSSLKDITWYFLESDKYRLGNTPWFCRRKSHVMFSSVWGTIAFLYSFLPPGFAFVLILMLNAFTVRHIVCASRARRRLRARSSLDNPKDPEMKSGRKSIILLFFISANFMLLWSELMVYSMWQRMWWLDYNSVILPAFVKEMGFMLQLLSCCTNTVIYVVTQTQFREQLKNVLKYPFSPIIKNK
ncbi:probable G-protein coupled receptor 139 [Heterodontus francisci]|uniref:probable G-protein coupled receptor 139 n=1 Tax=Heterodontus francisci TaxID=7792 RepID=UPI00355AD7FB